MGLPAHPTTGRTGSPSFHGGKVMTYLNPDCINGVSAAAFQSQRPYPWAHMQDTLTAEGWNKLRATLPDIAQFERWVGVKRGYGQAPHNRGILHYRDGMALAEPWKEFIAELQGKGLRSVPAPHAGPQTQSEDHPHHGVVLCLAGLLRFAALRCPTQDLRRTSSSLPTTRTGHAPGAATFSFSTTRDATRPTRLRASTI